MKKIAVLARAALGLPALLSLSAGATLVDTGRAQCCSSIAPELPPATYYGATLYREDDPLGQFGFEAPVARDSQRSLQALKSEVDRLEALGGPMAAKLSQPIAELGYASLSADRVNDAIAYLRRAIHLARVENGLYTSAQEEMLEQLIAAYLRQGDFAAADQQQAYLYRVRQYQKLPPANPRMREATLRYADWMRGVYLGDVDDARYPRLVGLNDLYESAIDEIAASEGAHSKALLPYLQGRIELSYLISVYPGEQASGFRASTGQPTDFNMASEAQLRFLRLRDFNFRYGLQALERAEEVLLANPDSSPEQLARARIARADWYQWHRRHATAIRLYEEAWGIMAGEEGAADWLHGELGNPQELPRSRVFNPGAVPLGTLHSAEVQIGFRVNRLGEARDIRILTEAADEQTQSTMNRAYYYLRNTRFRPSLENGKVVDADNVQRIYQIRY